MIRLVHQFDSLGTRAQVASPKSSGCSCCCCCCVATVLTSGVLTARAVGRVPPKSTPETIAPWADLPASATAAPATTTPPKRKVLGWKALGFFLLPLAVIAGGVAGAFMPRHYGGFVGSFTFLGAYLGGLIMLRQLVGLRGGWIIGLLVGLPFAVAAEVAVWFGLVFH